MPNNEEIPSLHSLDRRLAVVEERMSGDARALKLQFKADRIHFEKLNGEQIRIADIQSRSVTAEKFTDYSNSQHDALQAREKNTSLWRKGMEEKVSIMQNASSNLTGRFWALGVGLGLVVIVLQVVLHYYVGVK